MTFKYMVHVTYHKLGSGEVTAATATLVESSASLSQLRKSYDTVISASLSKYCMSVDILRVD